MQPPKIYAYSVLARGDSSWSFLEGMADRLEKFLNDEESLAMQRRGWELFQVNTLNDKQGNNGFLLIFRREVTA
jgi:hypothetical protein